jgi:hypothetical protein
MGVSRPCGLDISDLLRKSEGSKARRGRLNNLLRGLLDPGAQFHVVAKQAHTLDRIWRPSKNSDWDDYVVFRVDFEWRICFVVNRKDHVAVVVRVFVSSHKLSPLYDEPDLSQSSYRDLVGKEIWRDVH